MRLKLVAVLTLVSGVAHAAQQIEIPVEVTTVEMDKARSARWEEFRDIPHDKAVDLITAGQQARGTCHELPAEKIVVCYYPEYQPQEVGIDWQKLSKSIHAADVTATTSDELKMASGALQVDGITDARIVEVLEPNTPFVFTYCRNGSTALWRHEVMSTEAPDAPHAAQKIVRDQAVESDSKSCKVAS